VITGITTGSLDLAFRSFAISLATEGLFSVVGSVTGSIAGEFGADAARVFNIGAHALVGCGASVASGGTCGSGALSAGITAAAGPFINGPDHVVSLIENAALGGVASVAGGGKFANGAVTGAFGYLFNDLAHMNHTRDGFFLGLAGGAVAAGVCDVASVMVCTPADPAIVGGGGVMGAIGGLMSDIAESAASISSGLNALVHGNALSSTRPTWVYELENASTGDALKYGITSATDPEDRYSQTFYRLTNSQMVLIQQYPDRATARSVELGLCTSYVAANGRLPPLRWPRLSEQLFRVDKWRVCRG
jgi:hypothetical protein